MLCENCKENEVLKSLGEEQKKKSKIEKVKKKILHNEKLGERKTGKFNALRKDLTRKNHDLKALEAELKELNERLYGGVIKNIKEIESAGIKVDNLKEQISCLEEKIIDGMLAEERMEEELNQFKDELDGLKKRFQRYCAHHETSIKRLEDEKKRLADLMSEIIDNTDPLLWKRYEALKAEKRNPVAMLTNGICSGCNLSVSLGNYHRAQDETMIMRCEHCGRILYVDKNT